MRLGPIPSAANDITEVTRRGITDWLRDYEWAGRLAEDEFLSRLYDLNSLPSDDGRYPTAVGDIYQHRMSFRDWKDDWVFDDQRFNLIRSSDESFLNFLCETVHPVVRPNSNEAIELANRYNKALQPDGWQLTQSGEISGRPVFVARKKTSSPEIFKEPTGWPKVDRQIGEVRLRLQEADNEEQCQSVGHLCREVLISVAQAVYTRERYPTVDGVDPSDTDAKRKLEAFFNVELAGGSFEAARKHAKAACDLANGLQHDRKAEFRDAALCAEAAVSVVRIVANTIRKT